MNLKSIKEVYGDEIVEIISDNIDIIEKNIKNLKEYGFDDVEGIFERLPMMFTYFNKSFKEKMDKLINELGNDYVEIIQNDISILDEVFK